MRTDFVEGCGDDWYGPEPDASPCPICGSPPDIECNRLDEWSVYHSSGGCSYFLEMSPFGSMEGAAAAWNRWLEKMRADPAAKNGGNP